MRCPSLDSKRLITEYITHSRLVTFWPCFLFSSLISPHIFSVDGQVRLRNGELISSDILINLKTSLEHPTHDYSFPVYFNRGLYVELVGEILEILDDCGDTSDISNWGGFYDGLDPVDETTIVKQGGHSMKLGIDADKNAATNAFWLNEVSYGDLSAYQHDWLYVWGYFPTLDYVVADGTALQLQVGSAAGEYVYFAFAKSEFSIGWNLLKCDIENPSGSVGVVDWTNIDHVRLYVFEVVGNTHDFVIYINVFMFVRPFSGATDGITEGVTVQYLIDKP